MRRAARILVVDDDAHLLDTLTDYLTSQDYTTIPALTIADALKVFDLILPDVVLLDTSMPDSGPIAALWSLRTSHPDVPIITMMSSRDASFELARETLRWEAFDCVVKPTDFGDLLPLIRAALAYRG